MKSNGRTPLATSLALVAALALAGGTMAQTAPATPAPTTPAPAAKGHHAGAMGAHHNDGMVAECKAMMAKHQEMQDRLKTMDATLDKLVAEMNAASTDPKPGAMEKPMAAVVNEMVSQRRAMRSMMTDMQPGMMAHMMHHMHATGKKGAKDMAECPMMKMDPAKGDDKPHSM